MTRDDWAYGDSREHAGAEKLCAADDPGHGAQGQEDQQDVESFHGHVIARVVPALSVHGRVFELRQRLEEMPDDRWAL